MPNGSNKNFVRMCLTINGFHARYGTWPTTVRVPPFVVPELRDHILGPEAFARVELKIRVIPQEGTFVAEDEGGGRFDYDADHDSIPAYPKIDAREWLGVDSLPGMSGG